MVYTVLGIFANRVYAENAINELEDAGYNPKDMFIVMKDESAAKQAVKNAGALINLGIPEEDARIYEQSIQEGRIFLAVPAQTGSELKVEEILKASNATTVRAIAIDQYCPRSFYPDDTYEEDLVDTEYTDNETFDQPAYSFVGTKGGRARNTRRMRREAEKPTVSGEPGSWK